MAKLAKFANLLVERRGPRLYVALNRPQARNALSREMVAELSTVAELLEESLDLGSQALVAQPKGTLAMDPLTALDPGKFLTTPGLWIGLAFAAIFLAAAVRLRRYREPI